MFAPRWGGVARDSYRRSPARGQRIMLAQYFIGAMQMTIRNICAVIFAALFSTAANAATRIDDPVKFVRSVYDGFVKDPNHYDEPKEYYYTLRLKALWANERHDAGDEEGRIDFDPWVDAQACDIKTPATVTSMDVDSHKDRLVVIAQFTNIGQKENIHFYFERTAAGWLLDDMRSLRGTGWTLSTILKYGEDSDPDAK
jgi:hypothetical protein